MFSPVKGIAAAGGAGGSRPRAVCLGWQQPSPNVTTLPADPCIYRLLVKLAGLQVAQQLRNPDSAGVLNLRQAHMTWH